MSAQAPISLRVSNKVRSENEIGKKKSFDVVQKNAKLVTSKPVARVLCGLSSR